MATDALIESAVQQDPSRAPSHTRPVEVSTSTSTDIVAPEPEVEISPTAKPKDKESAALPSGKTLMASEFNKTILSGDKKIEFSSQEIDTISLILARRLEGIKDLEGSNNLNPDQTTALMGFDRVVKKLGPQAMERLKTNNFTREDFILVWVLINQQSQLASWAAKSTTEIQRSPLGREKIVPHDISSTNPDFYPILSATSEAMGIEEWSVETQDQYLIQLGNLQLSLEQKIFTDKSLPSLTSSPQGKLRGFAENAKIYFGKEPGSSLEISLSMNKSGHLIRDKVLDYARTELKNLYPDKTTEECKEEARRLIESDPLTYNEILFKAMESAYMDLAEDQIRGILGTPATDIDSDILEKRAVEIETPATPEELLKLQTEAVRAQAEFDAADTELKKFTDPEDQLKKDIAEQTQIESDADDALKEDGRLKPRINYYLDLIKDARDDIKNSSRPTRGDAEAFAKFEAARAERTLAIAELEKQLQALYDSEDALSIQRKTADRKKTALTQEQTDMQNDTDRNSERQKAVNTRDSKKNALGTAKQNLENVATPDEGEDAIKAKKEKTAGIRDIKRARDKNFEGRIPEKLFAPASENEFAISHLASITGVGDQLDGADRIRKLAFGTDDPKDYSPERARKIWDDEAIARSIVWVYQIPQKNLQTTLPEHIRGRKNRINELEAIQDRTPEQITNLEMLKAYDKNETRELLKKVLPILERNPRFKAYDLMRFLIDQSIKSAAMGNPELEIPDDYKIIAPRVY